MRIAPSVSINGTDGDTLFGYWVRARRSVASAITAVGDIAPNGRDYQAADYGPAVHAHAARMLALVGVERELSDICEAIGQQCEARRRQRGGA
mgnify:CR=1 FL=1